MKISKKVFALPIIALMATLGACTTETQDTQNDNDNQENQESEYPENTSELWIDFVEAQASGESATLLDFSYAGYHHGQKEAPVVSHKIYNVTDPQYGAVADDTISDRDAVLAAIAEAEANGSGIIFFPRGRYYLNVLGDEDAGAITITSSNIVLRGEGSQEGGTELFMSTYNNPTVESQMYSSPMLIAFNGGYTSGVMANVVADAARGSFSVEVDSASSIAEGDWVILDLDVTYNETLISQELSPFVSEIEASTSIRSSGVEIADYHQVKSVNGNIVTFVEPIMRKVEVEVGGQAVPWTIRRYIHQEEVGVEDIAFVGNWQEDFIHHESFLHDGGYKPLQLKSVVNSWVRRCRFTDVSEALSVTMCANVSVYDCVIDGNLGHSAIRSAGSSRVFIGKIYDEPAQWHSVGVSGLAMGTVLWRTESNDNTSFELHGSQPRATLFDACKGGFMAGRGGGDDSAMPNHLHDLFYWNFNQTSSAVSNWSFINDLTCIMPTIVGWHGSPSTFDSSTLYHLESSGTAVYPESLYEAQLELRLGSLPAWLQELKYK